MGLARSTFFLRALPWLLLFQLAVAHNLPPEGTMLFAAGLFLALTNSPPGERIRPNYQGQSLASARCASVFVLFFCLSLAFLGFPCFLILYAVFFSIAFFSFYFFVILFFHCFLWFPLFFFSFFVVLIVFLTHVYLFSIHN